MMIIPSTMRIHFFQRENPLVIKNITYVELEESTLVVVGNNGKQYTINEDSVDFTETEFNPL
jgi:hypothetical protein